LVKNRVACSPSTMKAFTILFAKTNRERNSKFVVWETEHSENQLTQVFTIDSEKLSQLSPVFRSMCFGRDFENGRELVREVVDESSQDIAIFLHCVYDHSLINEWNFATLLRLSNKYQVNSLASACGEFVLKTTSLDGVKADQVLTMLIAAHDYHQPLFVIKRLILRLANEDKTVFTRLKVNRFLPGHIYSSLISTNLNLAYLKQVEGMNGHLFQVEQNRVLYKRSLCVHCKKIVDAAECEGCRQSLCREHSSTKACSSEYGGRMLYELRQNIVELSMDDQ